MNLPPRVDGSKIREARDAADLSQSQLASKIGAHVTSISDWERGAGQPSTRHLAGLAEALAQPLEFFFRSTPRQDGAPGAVDGDGTTNDRQGVHSDAA